MLVPSASPLRPLNPPLGLKIGCKTTDGKELCIWQLESTPPGSCVFCGSRKLSIYGRDGVRHEAKQVRPCGHHCCLYTKQSGHTETGQNRCFYIYIYIHIHTRFGRKNPPLDPTSPGFSATPWRLIEYLAATPLVAFTRKDQQ